MNHIDPTADPPPSPATPPSATSERKQAASRQNGRGSRGAKTPAGKLMSRGNALTHGFLATAAVILARDGGESAEELVALRNANRAHFQPVGHYEEQLVDRHTLCDWQEARVVRYETAAIERQLAEFETRVEQAQTLAVAQAMRHVGEARCEALRETSRGVEYLLTVLEDLYWEVQQGGGVTDEMRTELLEHLGETAPLVIALTALAPVAASAGAGEANAAEASETAVVTLLKKAIRQLNVQKKALKQKEAEDLNLKRRCLALPGDQEMARIVRYGGEIERRRWRIVHELERVQRLRGGEAVPPPVAVDLQGGE